MMDRLLNGIYMPHGYCLLWEPWLVTIHAASDVLTFGAYSAIPLAIWIFVTRRPNIEMKGLARLFAAFILWCGLTHLFNVITLWHPIYELQGLVKAITAAVSVSTAVLIFPLIPKALAIPSPNELQIANAQLEREVAAHKRTLEELREARLELEQRVEARTKALGEATMRFRALFEHAPIAMLMVDRAGKVQQMNAAAEEVFAASSGDLVGQVVEELVPESLRDMHPKLRKAFVEKPTARPMGAGRELFARRKNGEQFPVEIGLNPIPGSGDTAVIASVVDISHRRREEQRMQFIMRELSHRSKNLLAVIQAMARQAVASSPDFASFEKSFAERLQGLARSHELLVGKNWQGAAIADLVEAQLAFVKRGDNLESEGPEVLLTPQAAQTLGLALHELGTNAVKHGALRTDQGRVHLSWCLDENGPVPRLLVRWEEHGGSPIGAAERKGFGRTVLERVVPSSLAGAAVLSFVSDGVRWELDVPLDRISNVVLPKNPDRPPARPAATRG
jgi:PAS domain S-box-containing protein